MTSATDAALTRLLAAYDLADEVLLQRLAPQVGACACAEDTTPSVSGWPRCPGVLRRYESGNAACDCGEHIEPAPALA